MYRRYRDDVLVLTHDTAGANRLFGIAKQIAAACWTLEVERTSSFSISMLDVRLYKGLKFAYDGRLDFCPYIKPSARHVPLSCFSAHAPSVHRGWPMGEIRRMHKLSGLRSVFEMYRNIKINRFRRFMLKPAVIQSCVLWRPPTLKNPRRSQGHLCLRAIVDWHPALSPRRWLRR